MENKILVVYYSRDGHTKKVAQNIASQLQADLEEILDQTDRKGVWGWLHGGRDAIKHQETTIGPVTRNPADYDLTIIGTPVWGWAMTPAVRTYLKQFKERFKDIAYVVTSGGTKPDAIVKTMEELTGKPAKGFIGLVGTDFRNNQAYQEKIKSFVELLGK
jgi:flavodoxin